MLDEVRHMLLQGGEARSDQRLPNINAALEILPQALHWVQLGAVGRQPQEDNILWDRNALRPMRRRLVQEEDIEAVGIVVAKLPEKDAEAVRIEARQLPPERVACGGLHGGIEPIIFIQRLNDLDGLHAIAGELTVERQVQTQPTFILAEDPYGLVGRLPP